jgi:hypothetical protein
LASLKEFLKKQAEEQRTGSAEREAMLHEWATAVDRLVELLAGWLRESDPEKVLTIEKTKHDIRERGLGSYQASGLRVTLGARVFRIEPVARFSIGSIEGDTFGTSIRSGRVDMTNDELKYMLYRNVGEGADSWLMADDRTYRARPLDRGAFEAAVLSMLQ